MEQIYLSFVNKYIYWLNYFIFELYEDEKGDLFIRILYNNVILHYEEYENDLIPINEFK